MSGLGYSFGTLGHLTLTSIISSFGALALIQRKLEKFQSMQVLSFSPYKKSRSYLPFYKEES